MKTTTITRMRLLRLAGALLFLAGAGVSMGIITAESLYPRVYTTGGNMISDLGGTEPPNSIVLQPSATIFDTTMIVAGALIMLGAVGLYAARRSKAVGISTLLFGAGALGVGVFPGDTGGIHELFAILTFVSGGVAAVLSWRVLTGPMRVIAVVLGAVALVNIGAYLVLEDAWFVTGLGLGGLERWIAYPIVLWLVGFGGYLMGSRVDR
jgi:hypothetical membrane protein